ncbi:MAG: hypothetical protein JNL72_00445, partial [Flavipsychrobacter sp.]|nr:hypothetical protein [Flavipsychrobacter sp.]
MTRYRIGIVIDDIRLPAWVARVIELLAASGLAELSVTRLPKPGSGVRAGSLYRVYQQYDARKPLPARDAMALTDM